MDRKTKIEPTRSEPSSLIRGVLVLRLYVAGNSRLTRDAIVNINKLCEQYLDTGKYDLEVINISENPELAKEANIFAVPTLIKKFPLPLRRFIGDLSRTEHILIGMDVKRD